MTVEQQRLEELRLVLRSESISYGELAELRGLVDSIDRSDVELMEAAGVPEQGLYGWKVIEAVVLVRDDDAEDLRDDVAKLIEFSDLSLTGYATSRDPKLSELMDFAEAIEDLA